MSKPSSVAALKRSAQRPSQHLRFCRSAALEINRQTYTIKLDGKEIFFPKKEFELLAFLASNSGKVFTREALLRRIWGESVYVIDRTVDVHISKIREKLGEYSKWIETVKGVGYRFREQVTA